MPLQDRNADIELDVQVSNDEKFVEQAKNYRTNFTEVNRVKTNLLLMSDELEEHYGGAVLNDRSAIGKTFANHSYLDHKSFANMSLLKTSLEGRVRVAD